MVVNSTNPNISSAAPNVVNNSQFGGSSFFKPVAVRVLSDLGGNNYSVIVNGQQINVKSQVVLVPGQNFKAQVFSKQGTIYLTPESVLETTASEIQPLSQSLTNLLNNYGVLVNDEVLQIVKFMEQSGFKLDGKIISKAQLIGKKFSSKSKKSSELAALLLEDGIESQQETIEKYLIVLENADQSGHNSGNGKNQSEQELLAIQNHLARDKMHWIILPYQWQHQNKNRRGLLRILINTETKQTEKVSLSVNSIEKNVEKTLWFMLYYNMGVLQKTLFYSEPQVDLEIKEEFLRQLGAQWSEDAKITGICSTDQNLLFVDQTV